ncbi:MAG: glycogen/starch/alpha-glucan family phosphorylase, partial [Limosilactobacillus mucosae]
MSLTKSQFKQDFKRHLKDDLALDIDEASYFDMYKVLAGMVKSAYNQNWHHTWRSYDQQHKKQLYYFSIEFLPGRMLQSNLFNLGWLDIVKDGMKDLGVDFEKIVEQENDMALGNGGLGRLASSFMDALASDGFAGNGNGIRYKYGLFKQKFIDGYQVELPNNWLNEGNVWEERRETHSVMVRFGGQVFLKPQNGQLVPVYEGSQLIKAVPYDTGMVGYENGVVNTLRLWDAEIPEDEESKYRTIDDLRRVEDLTSVLYPDDSTEDGRRMRIRQEYFFVSAGLQSIINHYLKKYDQPLTKLDQYVAVHINDTHPSMAIAELMRLLMDEHGLSWKDAWKVTVNVMSYTNHTIMAEAMERWDINMMQQEVPRVLQIIQEIDRRFVLSLEGKYDQNFINRTRIIANNQVHMAHLAIIGSHSINGVAKLHTELLKKEVLHDFYRLYPERFNNKTNGVTLRRWMAIDNPRLAAILDQEIGTDWRENPLELEKLLKYRSNNKVLDQLIAAKQANKRDLAKFIKQQTGIEVSSKAIFDVQIKRLHAYKRQLLNLLRIVKLYQDLKANPNADIYPRVFIFGAKAAPSYQYAKAVIKCINEVANLVNNDPDIHDKLKVVFLENYNVSLADRIIPAADVSEQISLASKEASGTSNMKLMANGA